MTETKKQKNNKFKLLILMIIAILVISLLAISSYAKYITVINGNGNLQVGKWSFKVNNSENDIGTINLGRKEFNASTIAQNEIAPGTNGEFTISVDASGTTTGLNYNVEFSDVLNKPTNLYFKIGEDATKYYDMDSLANALSGKINADDVTKTKEFNLKWAWDYETTKDGTSVSSNDEIDTTDGKTAEMFSFNMAVTGTQVLPTL